MCCAICPWHCAFVGCAACFVVRRRVLLCTVLLLLVPLGTVLAYAVRCRVMLCGAMLWQIAVRYFALPCHLLLSVVFTPPLFLSVDACRGFWCCKLIFIVLSVLGRCAPSPSQWWLPLPLSHLRFPVGMRSKCVYIPPGVALRCNTALAFGYVARCCSALCCAALCRCVLSCLFGAVLLV